LDPAKVGGRLLLTRAAWTEKDVVVLIQSFRETHLEGNVRVPADYVEEAVVGADDSLTDPFEDVLCLDGRVRVVELKRNAVEGLLELLSAL
jgi:hypothetical protein